MQQILTLTLNPALDFSTSAPQVVTGQKLRCAKEVVEPGGGGVNVARAVSLLGGQAQAMVALGGSTGAMLRAQLDARGIDVAEIQSPGDTRLSFSVTDRASAEQYRFVLQGPVWTEEDLSEMIDGLARASRAGAYVVLSGSMPPGSQPGFLPRVCARLPGRRVVIDTSGPHLEHQATGPEPAPYVLRMNGPEAEGLAGEPLDTREASARFAETLRQRGAAEIVVVARGGDGSVMATAEGQWHGLSVKDGYVSAIGAGDSFVGGLVLALAQGETPPEALRRGCAAASAAVMRPGSELCQPGDYTRLLTTTTLTRL